MYNEFMKAFFTTVTPFSKVLALSLFVLFPVWAFFFGSQYGAATKTIEYSDTLRSQSTLRDKKIIKTSKLLETKLPMSPVTFDPNSDLLPNTSYPTIITAVAPNVIFCSPTILVVNEKNSISLRYNAPNNELVYLTDDSLISVIKGIQKKNPDQNSTVEQIVKCQLSVEKTIYLYSLGPCLKACVGEPFLQIDYKTGESKNILISNGAKTWAYYTCSSPLFTSINDDFYFKCGAGDGGGVMSEIYKLSSDEKITRIYSCKNEFVNEKYVIACKQ